MKFDKREYKSFSHIIVGLCGAMKSVYMFFMGYENSWYFH